MDIQIKSRHKSTLYLMVWFVHSFQLVDSDTLEFKFKLTLLNINDLYINFLVEIILQHSI